MERYRTIPRRIAAWTIDLLPFLPAFTVGGIYYGHSHGTVIGIAWTVTLSSLGAAYSIYFHARYGATPGKSLLKLRVVAVVNEEKIGFRHAFLRESPWILMGAPGVFEDHFATPDVADVILIGTSCWLFADNVVAIYHPKRRALHDIIGRTVVIVEER